MHCSNCGIELSQRSLEASQYDLILNFHAFCDVCRSMYRSADEVFRNRKSRRAEIHETPGSGGYCGEPSHERPKREKRKKPRWRM
jgi:hypothetical protein